MRPTSPPANCIQWLVIASRGWSNGRDRLLPNLARHRRLYANKPSTSTHRTPRRVPFGLHLFFPIRRTRRVGSSSGCVAKMLLEVKIGNQQSKKITKATAKTSTPRRKGWERKQQRRKGTRRRETAEKKKRRRQQLTLPFPLCFCTVSFRPRGNYCPFPARSGRLFRFASREHSDRSVHHLLFWSLIPVLVTAGKEPISYPCIVYRSPCVLFDFVDSVVLNPIVICSSSCTFSW